MTAPNQILIFFYVCGLLSFLSCTPQISEKENINPMKEKPAIDVNKPIENPALVAAIERLARENSDKAKDLLLVELNKANYLAAILTDEMHTSAPDEHGKTVIQKDSIIKVIETSDAHGNRYLPLFTDWKAIGEYTNKPVSTLVLPASDAWSFALHVGKYDGIVINPGRNALPLNKDMIKYLVSQTAPNHQNKPTK